MRRYRWRCPRCYACAGVAPTSAEALRHGLDHYDQVHRTEDTAAMEATA